MSAAEMVPVAASSAIENAAIAARAVVGFLVEGRGSEGRELKNKVGFVHRTR